LPEFKTLEIEGFGTVTYRGTDYDDVFMPEHESVATQPLAQATGHNVSAHVINTELEIAEDTELGEN
jgi:hypothetical protein